MLTSRSVRPLASRSSTRRRSSLDRLRGIGIEHTFDAGRITEPERWRRGSQDSNLGPPVLETGATTKLSYCPMVSTDRSQPGGNVVLADRPAQYDRSMPG